MSLRPQKPRKKNNQGNQGRHKKSWPRPWVLRCFTLFCIALVASRGIDELLTRQLSTVALMNCICAHISPLLSAVYLLVTDAQQLRKGHTPFRISLY